MIWIRNAIDEYVFTNLNKYFSLPACVGREEGSRAERRIGAQIPILVLYVSLKWLILWRYLDTHVEELSVFEFFMTLAGVVRRRRHAWGAVCDFNSKAFEKLTTNSFYVEHEMPLRFHASHVVRWDCGVFGEVDLMGIGSAHGMRVWDYFHATEQGSR